MWATFAADSITFLTPNTPLTLRLTAESPIVVFYEADTPQVVSITAQAKDSALDTVLEVLSPSGERLAYNDDTPTTQNSALVGLPLPVAGRYMFIVDSFNGVSEGDITLTLTEAQAVRVISAENNPTLILEVTLSQHTPVYPVITTGRWHITARDPLGKLDPILTLLTASGDVLAQNDDHASDDLTLNLLDSRLSVRVAAGDQLQVRDFLGRAGVLFLELSPQ